MASVMHALRISLLAITCAVGAVDAAHAATGLVTDEDTLIAGARLCTREMPVQEKKYGIPRHMMMAIGANESGRYHKGLNAVVPWPWTVNAEGRGYYFASKTEAIAAVRRMQLQGIRSMDIGCMQVNLKHHPNAFTSLQNAFDPSANIAYAAQFLRRNYEATNSWAKAVAYYHSQTPKFGTPYAQAVYGRWRGILARAGQTPSQALASAIAAGSLPREAAFELASLENTAVRSDRPADRARRSGTAMRTRREAPSMKIIKVYRNDPQPDIRGFSREEDHGVTVIRADRAQDQQVADARESATVSAVSSMVIQDIAEAQARESSSITESGVMVTRGQFNPRSVSSAQDDAFVIRN